MSWGTEPTPLSTPWLLYSTVPLSQGTLWSTWAQLRGSPCQQQFQSISVILESEYRIARMSGPCVSYRKALAEHYCNHLWVEHQGLAGAPKVCVLKHVLAAHRREIWVWWRYGRCPLGTSGPCLGVVYYCTAGIYMHHLLNYCMYSRWWSYQFGNNCTVQGTVLVLPKYNCIVTLLAWYRKTLRGSDCEVVCALISYCSRWFLSSRSKILGLDSESVCNLRMSKFRISPFSLDTC